MYGSLALAVLASVAGSRYALTYVFNQTLAVFLALGALIGFLILPHQRYQVPPPPTPALILPRFV